MPDRSAFATSDDYYRIALHELTHWSGHPSRCNRVLSSLDGMTLEGNLVLEIKCPLRGTRSDLWLDVSAGQVPEHYAVQVQHQLMVSGAKLAHLWVFDGTKGNGDHMTCAARARAPWPNWARCPT